MKFKDNDGNEYEIIKKESSVNWKHIVVLVSLFLAPSNINWNGFYIFGDIFALFASWTWIDIVNEISKKFNLGKRNEKGEFINASDAFLFLPLLVIGWGIGLFMLMFIFSTFGILCDFF